MRVDCQTCVRGSDCELLLLARNLGIREIPFNTVNRVQQIDQSTPALARDPGKCIKCRRCETVCAEVQHVGAISAQYRGYDTVIGPAFASPLATVACVQCGQCAAVCPTGAITEISHVQGVWNALDDPKKHVVVLDSPGDSCRLSESASPLSRELWLPERWSQLCGSWASMPSSIQTSPQTSRLSKRERNLLTRLKRALVDNEEVALPQYTSCSPGWIKYAEYFHPEILPNISTCKSPQQMFGALAKTYYAQKIGVEPKDMTVVSIMPCTAKKFECQRSEMDDSGYQDVDYAPHYPGTGRYDQDGRH